MALELQNNDIAGTGGSPEAGSSASFPAFLIDHAKDGEMLQFSAEKPHLLMLIRLRYEKKAQ